MKLQSVDARLLDDPCHLGKWGIDEHSDGEYGSLRRGTASGVDAGSRRCRGDLPSRWRKNEPDKIYTGGCCGCRVLRFTQAADFHHTATSE